MGALNVVILVKANSCSSFLQVSSVIPEIHIAARTWNYSVRDKKVVITPARHCHR